MGIFFVYILKSSICLAAFYLFYRLLLSRETFHRFNRFTLLSLLLLSCLLPLVEISVKQQSEVHQTMMTLEQWLLLADMMSDANQATQVQENTLTWIQIAFLVYLAGIFFFVLRNLYSLFRLALLLKSGKKEDISQYVTIGRRVTLIVHSKEIAPFSWMNYIVIAQKDLEENGREILIHELAHIRNRHSWDLLVADICIFIQWFNPASWLLKQELQNIHEYEADETVINEGVDAKQYQLLLIKKAVGTRLYSMANSFNHSKLKKRITMMLKEKSSPWARLKYLYVLPVAAIAITAFARPEVSNATEEISAVKVNDFAAIVEKKVAENAVPKDTLKPKQIPTARLEPVVVVGYKADEVSEADTPVFEVVEQMPEYSGGGMGELMKYLAMNVRYPKAAQEAGVQGRVMVQFIVDKEGNITHPNVIRPVNRELDAEAIRVVKAMPRWKPGKQKGEAVAVKFTIPVMFLLQDRVPKEDTTKPLCFVNGKEVDALVMSALDPNKIESVSVLKDKEALEAYGERGKKNGVVLIKLKPTATLTVTASESGANVLP